MIGRPQEIKTELGQRFRVVRGNVAQHAFCDNYGFNLSTYGNYERGDRLPDAEWLESFRTKTGVDLNWLLSGQGRPWGFAEAANQSGQAGNPRTDDPLIQLQPLRPAIVRSENAIVQKFAASPLAVTAGFLTGLGLDAGTARYIFIETDMMAPTMREGAMVIVDNRAGQLLRTGGIFALAYPEEIVVGRALRRTHGGLEWRYDNPVYAGEILEAAQADTLPTPFRVVWYGTML